MGVFVLLVGAFFLFSGLKKDSEPKGGLSKIEIGIVTEVVSSSGPVKASGVTEVSSPTEGLVKRLLVKNGDTVKKDQPLFEVTSTATEAEKAAALADLLAARAALKKAENDKNTLQSSLESARRAILDAENTKKVFDENVLAQKPNPSTGRAYTEEEKLSMQSTMETTRRNFGNLEKQYLDANESIRSGQAALAEANVAYRATQDSVTKSPADGVVSNLRTTVGSSVVTTKSLLVIKSSVELQVEIDVSEFNVSKIKNGQSVVVTLDAIPREKIAGTVLGVDGVGNESLGTVSFGVTVVLEPTIEQEELIRPAMTANVTIITSEKNDVMTLPRSAVKIEDSSHFVMIWDGKKATKKEVNLGLVGNEKVEVVEGLSETDEVLTVFEDKNEK